MALGKSLLERYLQRSFVMKSPKCRSLTMSSDNKIDLSAETVLSKNNRESCIKKLKLYPPMKFKEGSKTAAVLVPLCSCRGELGILYTLRSLKLSSNAGQVCFPGGRVDDDDKSLEATALRETWEELKIPQKKVDVWCTMNLVGRSSMSVKPVLGYIGDVEPERLSINRDEVEEAFVISLEKLCDPKHFHHTQFLSGWSLPAYTGGKHRVWGMTAALTHSIMKALVPFAYKNDLKTLPKIIPTKTSIFAAKWNS